MRTIPRTIAPRRRAPSRKRRPSFGRDNGFAARQTFEE
jgi:hypothetical protein